MSSFQITGITRCLNAVKHIEKNYPKAIKEGANITFEKAQQVAQDKYTNAEYDGVNDCQVRKPQWQNDKTITLTAGGTSLLFIEFGTGIRHINPYNPYAINRGYGRGSYGMHNANIRHGLWIYKTPVGNKLNGPDGAYVLDRQGNRRNGVAWSGGNGAANGMYDALKLIQRDLIDNIAVQYVRSRK